MSFCMNVPCEAACEAPIRPLPTASGVMTDTAKTLHEALCILNDVRRALTGVDNDTSKPPVSDKPPCVVERLMFTADMAYNVRRLSEEILAAIGEV